MYNRQTRHARQGVEEEFTRGSTYRGRKRSRSRSPLLREPSQTHDTIRPHAYGRHHNPPNPRHVSNHDRYNHDRSPISTHRHSPAGKTVPDRSTNEPYTNPSTDPHKQSHHVHDSSDILWGGSENDSRNHLSMIPPSTYNYSGCSNNQQPNGRVDSNSLSGGADTARERKQSPLLPTPWSVYSADLKKPDTNCRWTTRDTSDDDEPEMMSFEYNHQPKVASLSSKPKVGDNIINEYLSNTSDARTVPERTQPEKTEEDKLKYMEEMERRCDEVTLFKDTDAYKQFDKRYPKQSSVSSLDRPVTPDFTNIPTPEWRTVFRTWQTDIYKYMKNAKKGLENDEEVLMRRQKNIDYMKTQPAYDKYLLLLPRHKRKARDPRTPDKYKKVSRRAWDGQIRSWKLSIHDRVTELEAEQSAT